MSPRSRQGFVWSELSPEEVLTLLQQCAAKAGHDTASGFIDTHQWSQFQDHPGYTLAGGHEHAQYRRLAPLGTPIEVKLLRIEREALPEPVHTPRQLRAWLYRAGIPDGALGDIIVGDFVLLAAEPDVEPAEVGLAANLASHWSPPAAPQERVTAASARVDAIVAALFNVSRAEAQKAIRHDFVFVNFRPVGKRTQSLAAGDQLVFRSKGRVQLDELDLNRRSGRLWVSFRRYPG